MHKLLFLILCTIAASASAQDKATPDAAKPDEAAVKKAVTEHWLGVADEISKDYVFTPLDAPDAPFIRQDKAIFRHTQTVRGDDIGAVYLWKEKNGRPAIIGVIFAWSQGRNRQVNHEFHSLYRKGVAMALPGKKTWTTEQPGLDWKPFPKSDAPALTDLKRKLQAKAMSRRVSANATDTTKARWELRLVPTAIYEYAVPEEAIDYGAVFSLCQGTDTELLVVLEARRDAASGKNEWQHAFASFTDYELAVSIDDQETWKSPDGTIAESGKPHYWDFLEQRPKPDFEP